MINFIFALILSISSIVFASDLVGEKFKDFYGKDESGKILKLSDIAGKGKPVVVVFWAIGDVDTYKVLPQINSIYDKYKDKVVFVAPLLSKSDDKEVKEAKKMIPLKLPVWLAGTDSIKAYSIEKVDVPYIVFISKDGKVVNIMKTARDLNQVEKNIKEIIK
ncbi:MAG: TlpA family protein disulfide reductase [Hydrogenothermaceae bacterium]|nr:TlpA family protein disulfide reductase [Hydrogenothermaceae bacterium]